VRRMTNLPRFQPYPLARFRLSRVMIAHPWPHGSRRAALPRSSP
jgi:hypothetical protein